MYGLPQAGILANKQLEQILQKHGWYQCQHTPGYWRNIHHQTSFCLIVDDFLVKYTDKIEANKLYNILNSNYEAVSIDWNAELFCGIKLSWDYEKRTCDLNMPKYVNNALTKFQHIPPTKPQHAPHRYQLPQYGAKIQYATPIDHSPPLDEKQQTIYNK